MDDQEKAGNIARECLEYGCSLIKPNVNALEVLDKIEKKIYELGGRPAFPAQISINHVAAHCIPDKDVVFKEDDVVKLDVGVHVKGKIGDNARTIIFNAKHKKLIEASRAALDAALNIIKPGITLAKIGSVIDAAITARGFQTVKNLSGHLLEEYEQHAGLTIPNFDNQDTTELEEGMVVAIEPFATTGNGMVEDGKDSGIYKVMDVKNIRDASSRQILQHILEEYKTLPFAKRWLLKKFSEFKVSFALRTLKREGILHEYKQLVEVSKGLVSQAEHTVIVGNSCKIITKE